VSLSFSLVTMVCTESIRFWSNSSHTFLAIPARTAQTMWDRGDASMT
jgi:hypothetical protein